MDSQGTNNMEKKLRLDTFLPKFKLAYQLWSKTLRQGGKAYLRKYRKAGKAVWRVRIQQLPH
jgi:hypothetical protein